MNRASPDLPVAIGRAAKPHGVRGEVKLQPFFEEALLALIGKTITLAPEKKGAAPLTATLFSLRGGAANLIASFDAFRTPEEAAPHLPALVMAPKGLLPPLEGDTWYFEEIIGLPVATPEGTPLGRLEDFFSAGEKDVWVIVDEEGNEIMIPCLDETLLKVDLEAERIIMRPLPEDE